MPRGTALLATIALLTGCFGYNRGAKGWSYVGDTLLIAGGGAAIGVAEATKPAACEGVGCPSYTPPVSGGIVVGSALIVAGLVGLVINATRPYAKSTSR